MSKQVRHDCDCEGGLIAHSLDPSLPECLAGLVSAEVWAESNKRVIEKLEDHPSRAGRKQLYMETLANHLEEEVDDESDATVEDAPEGLLRRAA